jgi:predicted RNA-binding Zn-ribbon protein involved in translation (DUF1610 family)
MSEEEILYVEEESGEECVLDIIGDMYVCENCGTRLTEIPAYNRFYCENCGLHY